MEVVINNSGDKVNTLILGEREYVMTERKEEYTEIVGQALVERDRLHQVGEDTSITI